MKISPVPFFVAGIALFILPGRIILVGETWGMIGGTSAALGAICLIAGVLMMWSGHGR